MSYLPEFSLTATTRTCNSRVLLAAATSFAAKRRPLLTRGLRVRRASLNRAIHHIVSYRGLLSIFGGSCCVGAATVPVDCPCVDEGCVVEPVTPP